MTDKSLIFLSTGDKPTRDLLELLRRKKVLIQASHTRARNAYRSELAKLEHEIIMLSERIASKIDGHHTEKEITDELNKVEKEITVLSENTLESIQSSLKSELKRLQSKLEELEKSLLGRTLAEELEINLVNGKRVNDPNIGDKRGMSILEKQGGKFLQEIGKLSSRVSRDLVYNVGKFIGIKFKPWGAVNGAKFIKGLGPFIAIGGVIFDAAMTAKEEQEQEENQRKLRQARAQIRKEFRKLAEEMRKEYESNIEEALILYDEELNDIESKQKDLSNFEQSKLEIFTQIENKRQEIKQEIKRLIK